MSQSLNPYDPARDPVGASHRDLYPEQYEDPLCGQYVRIPDATDDAGLPVEGTVARVVNSGFGRLAILQEYGGKDAWLAHTCVPTPRPRSGADSRPT